MPVVDDNVEQEIFIEADPAEVFGYFTDAALMRRWMGRDAKLDAQPGGGYRVEISDQDTAAGEYVVVEPPSRVVLSWGWIGSETVPPGSSTLEVTLTPADGGTRVRLVHSGLPAAACEPHAHGWAQYLPRLATAAAGGDPGPDPNATTTDAASSA